MRVTLHMNQELEISAKKPEKANTTSNLVDARTLHLKETASERMQGKRDSARKQAMKLISDAWGRDQKSADARKEMQDQKRLAVEERNELQKTQTKLGQEMEYLREEYQVEPDSEEQKDLELLMKYQNNKNGTSFDTFSEEEKNRLRELANASLTEYQKKALSLNETRGEITRGLRQKEAEILAMTQGITTAEIEKEKSQDMLKAQGTAETLIAAAEEDIFQMLIEEGKNHLEEEQKEKEEKAEERRAEKQEQDEKLEKAKENREEQEELIKNGNEAEKLEQAVQTDAKKTDHFDAAQIQVKELLKENHLINEDLKGIEIDLNF